MHITIGKNNTIIDGKHQIIDVGRLSIKVKEGKAKIKNCHFVNRIFKHPSARKHD